mgnify:CR=1 FL=1
MGLFDAIFRWVLWRLRRHVVCDLCFESGLVHFADGDTIRCYCGRPCARCGGSRVATEAAGNRRKCPACYSVPPAP